MAESNTYLGRIDIYDTFYNFKPLYEYVNGELVALTEADYRRILPESEMNNLNFSYNPNRDVEFMESTFFDDVLVVFTLDHELDANVAKSGFVNTKTAYKIRTRDEYERGKIKNPASIGVYKLLLADDISGDLYHSSVLNVGSRGLDQYSEVVILDEHEKMYVGPFPVFGNEEGDAFLVALHPQQNNYILPAWKCSDCSVIQVPYSYGELTYVKPRRNAPQNAIDVINDDFLLQSFKDSISNKFLDNGKLDFNDLDAAVDAYKNSEFFVNYPEIQKRRVDRISRILTISSDLDSSLKAISGKIGSALGTLLSKYDDREDEKGLINHILEISPELLERVPDYRAAKTQMAALRDSSDAAKPGAPRPSADQTDLLADMSLSTDGAAVTSAQGYSAGGEILSEDRLAGERAMAAGLAEKNRLLAEIEKLTAQRDSLHASAQLGQEIAELEQQKKQLEEENRILAEELSSGAASMEKNMADSLIDGMVANTMVDAASSWKRKQEQQRFQDIVSREQSTDYVSLSPMDMTEYMYQRVHSVRPLYDRNMITNLCICIFQNFLTVFAGEPGCGKTSICNIIAQALGLTMAEPGEQRYVPVSVERGWTSKRDFIGYYNPLTKTFDKNNSKVFDALQVLNLEARNGIARFPMMMLLDEANLSPMEYYWADFMNVCDSSSVSDEINVGEDQSLKIPETLHFVATINNDHTTETLSPRLIDRAAVITLPKVSLRDVKNLYRTDEIDPSEIKRISWDTVRRTYVEREGAGTRLPGEARKVYEDRIRPHFQLQQSFISPRTEIAMAKYCNAAASLFRAEDDPAGRDPALIALDYAVSQELLPKIGGFGEEYGQWLEELKNKCEDADLIRSRDSIERILAKGRTNMNDYQFFA